MNLVDGVTKPLMEGCDLPVLRADLCRGLSDDLIAPPLILAGVEDAASRIGPPLAHILETEVGGEISLYNPHNESVLVLNITASDVWRLSDGAHTLEEMVRLLAAAYRVQPEDIHRDVEQTIQNIIDKGFLPTEGHRDVSS